MTKEEWNQLEVGEYILCTSQLKVWPDLPLNERVLIAQRYAREEVPDWPVYLKIKYKNYEQFVCDYSSFSIISARAYRINDE